MTTSNGWTQDQLRGVADITMGQSPDSKYYSEEEIGLPFLQGCAEFQSRVPCHKLYCSHAKKIAPQGSILFSVRAPVGRLNIADRDYVIGRGLAAIRGTKVKQAYLEYALRLEEPRFRSASQGSTFEAINSTELGSWPIGYPQNPSEQAKIAEILSLVDRAIEQTEAWIAKQRRIKTGLMQDLLTRGIDEHGNLRSEAAHEFKDSSFGRIPAEWRVVPLGCALKDAKGFLQTGPFGSQLHAHEYTHEGVPVIMPQDILEGTISTALIARVPEKRADDLNRHRLVQNDVIFSRRGDLTRAAAIGPSEIGWLCGTGCFLLRVPSNKISARWLAHLYRHHWIQRQVDTNAVGSTMPSLNNGVMERLVFPFPGLDEQHEIARRHDAIDAAIRSLQRQLLKLRMMKMGLMRDLLSGDRRVTALLSNPKEVVGA